MVLVTFLVEILGHFCGSFYLFRFQLSIYAAQVFLMKFNLKGFSFLLLSLFDRKEPLFWIFFFENYLEL